MAHAPRRALSLPELLLGLAASCILVSLVLPMLAGSSRQSMVDQSMSNLITLNVSHHLYAAAWNGRQFTLAADDLGAYGSVQAYNNEVGEHPPILLGWGSDSNAMALWGYYMNFPGNFNLLWPIHPTTRFGWFRIPNAKQFHDYVNGRFYDPVFYVPGDAAVMEAVQPLLEQPYEFALADESDGTSELYWSSYCLSPAALFHPDVLDREIGYNDPFSFDEGFQTPPLNSATFPDLKTFMIEHNWVQNPPAECNPAFEPGGGTYDGCEPYYFNHGLDSSPVTLFYDGHVRLLPNTEVLAAHEAVRDSSRDGIGLYFEPDDIVFNAPGPLGSDGYFNEAGFDFAHLNHHILTIDGILGRDTINIQK